jgi:hypothetical protein
MSAVSERVRLMSVRYLGPAAKVFLERQTKTRMGGLEFDNLETRHLPELAKWVRVSASAIIDQAKAGELADRIAWLETHDSP